MRGELEELVEDYLVVCRSRKLSLATINGHYRLSLERVLLPWCKERGIERARDLTSRHLARLAVDLGERVNERTGQPLKPETVSFYLRAINQFLRWCAREGEGVTAEAAIPRLPRKVVEVLSRQEIDKMEAVARNTRDKLIVRLLADTGIRNGELCKLRVKDLQVWGTGGEYSLLIQGKGGRERLVPISVSLARRLRKYVESHRPAGATPEVFLSQRRLGSGEPRPLTESGVQQLIQRLAYEAGIQRRVYPHLFRHSLATHLLQQGMNTHLVAKLLGHTSTAMLDRVYAHVRAEDARAALLAALTH